MVRPTIKINEITSFARSPLNAGTAAPNAVAKPTAMAAQAITVTIHLERLLRRPKSHLMHVLHIDKDAITCE